MSVVDNYFHNRYEASRQCFLDACAERGIEVSSTPHPSKGIDGEALATDVALIGDPAAENILLVTSATHGVEGFGGSGIQVGCLIAEDRPEPAPGSAIALIHGVNPFGFSWLRRVNEDNIDMNRNFVDHQGGNYPENDLFELLYPHAVPKTWDEAGQNACDEALASLGEQHGKVDVRKALTKGQYKHPDSVHFGGFEAAWSNRSLYEICNRLLANARRAVMVDLHTGLGPYGYGELMTPSKPGEPIFDRLHGWFGDEVHSTTAGSSAYAGSKGSILAGFRPGPESLEWTPVGLEYGTLEPATVSRAMRGDIWLYVHGDPQSALGDEIRAQVRDAFYIDESRWKHMLWERGREVLQRVLEDFAAS